MNARRLFVKFKNNLSTIAFEGVGLSIILLIIMFILGANILRVIEKGEQNYNVYLYEKNILAETEIKHDELVERLNYVSTAEFQKLIAREVLGYVEPGAELYKTKENSTFYDVEKKLLNLQKKKDFTDWWGILVR